jgi:hypothetical protein
MPITSENNTLLVIVPLSGIPGLRLTTYSARDLTQTLEPTPESGSLAESVNGETLDLSYPWFKKLQSTVTCTDTMSPCLNRAWIGQLVVLQCVVERSFETGYDTPDRPVVSGSIRYEGAFTFYRPELTMRVTAIKNGLAEYKANYAWQIDFREFVAS